MTIKRWLPILCISILLTDCTHMVPLRHSLLSEEITPRKKDGSVLFVMTPEQAEAVFIYKGYALDDPLVFEGGAAFRDMFMDALQKAFSSVVYAEKAIDLEKYDFIIEACVTSAGFEIGHTLKTVNLEIDYKITPRGSGEPESLKTNVSSDDVSSVGKAVTRALFAVTYTKKDLAEILGRLWDEASEKSIVILFDRIS